MRNIATFIVASILCVGCATTGVDGQSNLAAASGEQSQSTPQGSKESLNEMLDEHDKVTLVDDEGKTKLVCRRVKPRTGTRLGDRKLCATPKQWREQEVLAKQEADKSQRNMNAGCPVGAAGCN